MILNPSQLKAVHLDAPLIVVPSGPGSGKTRTAVARTARLLRAGRSVLVLTFTNSGASEFRSRILGELSASSGISSQSIRSVSECTPRADFLTLHAYCFRLIRRHGHLIGYTSDGVSMLPPGDADELLEEVRDSFGVKMSLREFHRFGPGVSQLDTDPTLPPTVTDSMIQHVWTEYRFRLKRNNLVDYDRILFDGLALLGMPEVCRAVEVDHLIVDEAQDSAAIDWAIYSAIPAANRFFIGDVDQCQPAGTIVEMSSGALLPIENIRPGDSIVTYERHSKCLLKTGTVRGTSKRRFSGTMYTVLAGDRQTRCTANHRWLIKWVSRSQYQTVSSSWCTYLMRKGDHFRIGKTRFLRSSGNTSRGYVLGISVRFKQEQADALWVLRIHASNQEALAHEEITAANYGLPRACFKTCETNRNYTQACLNHIFESVPHQLAKAVRCLADHEREISYPLMDKKEPRTRRTLQEVRACNLLPEVMSVPVPVNPYTFKSRVPIWTPILVTHENYNGEVFSLDVVKHHRYVADGIVTGNSIFEFRAAYPEGFLRIAGIGTDTISGAQVLPLEENYRCGAAICAAANNLIKHNKSRYEKDTVSVAPYSSSVTVEGFDDPMDEMITMGESITRHMHEPWPISDHRKTRKSIAILCRTNYQVKQVREFLMSRGIPVHSAYSRGRFNQPQDWRRATLLTGLVVAPHNEIIVEQLLRLDNPRAVVNQWKLEMHAEGKSLCDRFMLAVSVGSREQLLHYLAVNGVSQSTISLIQQRAVILPEDATIADLLQDLHSRDLFEQQQPADTTYTGTVHSAKGKEFDVVFLPMFEESRMNDENIEENRRLAYVAITRARTHVHISFSRQRKSRWGATEETRPSRFIQEMGLELP